MEERRRTPSRRLLRITTRPEGPGKHVAEGSIGGLAARRVAEGALLYFCSARLRKKPGRA